MSTVISSESMAAILAHPRSIDARLVLADLLLTRGDPRGDLIAVQCAIARAPNPELIAREHDLLERHGAAWLDALGLVSAEATFRCGFVEEATLESTRFLELDTRLTQTPLCRLHLRDVGALTAITAASSLRTLEELHLEGRPLGPAIDREQLAAFTANAALPHLRALRFSGMRITAGALQVLAEAAPFAPLTSLRIENNEVELGSGAARAIASAKFAKILETLAIPGAHIQDDGGVILASSRSLRALRSLDLRWNGLGPRGLVPLLDSKTLANIEHLDLSSNYKGFDRACAKVLVAAAFAPRLRTLGLSWNERVDALVVKLFAVAPALATLERISLDGTRVRARDIELLATSLPNLIEIDVRNLPNDEPQAATRLRERFGNRVLCGS